MQSGGFLQGCEWAWRGCVGVYEQPGWLSKSATGKKEKRAGCSEAWVWSFRGHWCIFLWMECDEEVQGKHSNSNWKQTGASGTMPLHRASLSCLHAAAREGGFGRHGAESKPRDEYVLTKHATKKSLQWSNSAYFLWRNVTSLCGWLWGRRQKKNLLSAFLKTHLPSADLLTRQMVFK